MATRSTPLPDLSGATTFADLKRLIKEAGLLDRQPTYYALKITITFAMLGLSIALLFVFDHFLLHMLNAAFMAFVFVQFGLLAHDAAHVGIFRKPRQNYLTFLVFGNLIVGLDLAYWLDNHNAHHAHPNETEHDPNVNFPLLAFSEDQAAKLTGVLRELVKVQAYYFYLLQTLVAFAVMADGFRVSLTKQARYPFWQPTLLVVHHVIHIGLVVIALGPGLAVPFLLVQYVLMGIYLAMVFAPNHKGMPILDEPVEITFMHQQIMTARNVYGNPVNDFVFGGLNYQIEHHLFPPMPRNQLRHAQPIIKAFCAQNGIPYEETSAYKSYWEVLLSLDEISQFLRRVDRENRSTA
ncbi:MAG: acyl-CoA desaturase [Chloroflexi bacterium]|nr:acyl-CoA desaturase [Chloroflexota bacterium]